MTRGVARRVLRRWTVGRVRSSASPRAMGGFGNGPRRDPGRSYDYDATAEEVPEDADFDHRLPPASE